MSTSSLRLPDDLMQKVKDAAKRNHTSLNRPFVSATAERVGRGVIPRDAILCFDEYVGPGYSRPTPEMAEAVQMLARLEGILLDPVYTGKTMAGLIGLTRKDFFKDDENVLFLHTGGSPALYAYRNDVLG